MIECMRECVCVCVCVCVSACVSRQVVSHTIESKQDAVDYFTWTLFFRRLVQNPNYYSMEGVTEAHISDHLSQLVEDTVADLEVSE